MRKFYATRNLNLDGREYNPGEIVWHDQQIDGLRPAEEAPETKPKRPRAPLSKYLGVPGREPEISVVVTFHNQRQFAEDCLDGFTRQTIKQPYEIIAIDDASQDDTFKFITKKYPGVCMRFVNYKQANRARNEGLGIAKGKYVAFFDGDDYPYPEYLEKLYDAIEKNPGTDFAYARFDCDSYGLEKMRLPKCNIFEWTDSWCDFSNITNTPIMIRRDCVPEWDEELEIMQDTGYSLAIKAAGLTGRHVREKLWYYRLHPKGLWQGEIHDKLERAVTFLKKNRGYKDDRAEVTFVSLISRDEVLEKYFSQIPSLGIDRAHWLVFLDTNDEALIEKVKGQVKIFEKYFLSARIFVTGEQNLVPSKDFEERGMRIAGFMGAIFNQAAVRSTGTPYIFMVEDDTIAPRNAYKKLKKMISRDRRIAYVSGIECGRGFTRHTGVCWLKENNTGEIIGREIPKMRDSGIESIGGGGWYCWIGRTTALLEFMSKKKFRCYDGKMVGPDVCMVHDLKKLGYECLANFSIQCQHYDGRRRHWLPASVGKGYDIDYYQDDGLWKMHLKEKL